MDMYRQEALVKFLAVFDGRPSFSKATACFKSAASFHGQPAKRRSIMAVMASANTALNNGGVALPANSGDCVREIGGNHASKVPCVPLDPGGGGGLSLAYLVAANQHGSLYGCLWSGARGDW